MEHLREGSIAVVVIERVFEPVRQPSARNEKIEVTVIIVIGPGTCLIVAGIGRYRSGIGRGANGSITVVVPKEMFLVVAADEQIEPAIIVIVAPRATSEASGYGCHWAVGDLAERAVSLIVIKKAFLASGVRYKEIGTPVMVIV